MLRRYYIDPCIWRDYFEDRSDRFRPLGEWALKLINDIIENKDIILFSEMVIDELKIEYGEEKITEILNIVHKRNLLFKEDISEELI